MTPQQIGWRSEVDPIMNMNIRRNPPSLRSRARRARPRDPIVAGMGGVIVSAVITYTAWLALRYARLAIVPRPVGADASRYRRHPRRHRRAARVRPGRLT